MKLTIVSDGTPQGIKCVNAETGEAVERVVSITVQTGHNGLAKAIVEFNIYNAPAKAQS